jgi:hypothetical protein
VCTHWTKAVAVKAKRRENKGDCRRLGTMAILLKTELITIREITAYLKKIVLHRNV